MNITTRAVRPSTEPSFVELFTPKLITVLREGYGLAGFRADVVAVELIRHRGVTRPSTDHDALLREAVQDPADTLDGSLRQ